MKFIETKIKGVYVIEPVVFGDDRGFFIESYSKKIFEENGLYIDFIQDNHSKSSKGVLRGLHFQKPPFEQTKLVRVTSGEVLDVAVDMRVGSPTFGQHESIILTAENKKMFLIPKGFAHGFIVLSDTADFIYKVDNYYSKEHDGGLLWNDPKLGIDWKISQPILSEKDKIQPTLDQLGQIFEY